MDPEVEKVVAALEAKKLRATYGAVAKYLGVPQRSLGDLLGRKCPKASWVVNAGTGEPTGYFPTQMHLDLKSQSRIIMTDDDLRDIIMDIKHKK